MRKGVQIMWSLLRELDRILRGEATRPSDLAEGTIRIPVAGISFVIVLLAMIYGLCMSGFSLLNRDPVEWQHVAAPMLKVPALFLLTLIVTFPSLYVFNALVGSRLRVAAVLRLIVTAMAVTMAVLASFGPITAFFSFTTESYPFMVLFNVVIFGVAGVLGLVFLLQTLHRLSVAAVRPPPPPPPGRPARRTHETPADEDEAPPPAAIDKLEGHVLGPHVKAVFRIWILVFGAVGAQMAWVLRPFIGSPSLPFEWFRAREGSFFEAVWHHLLHLFS